MKTTIQAERSRTFHDRLIIKITDQINACEQSVSGVHFTLIIRWKSYRGRISGHDGRFVFFIVPGL